MSKGDFLFASPLQIPKLMIEFEEKYLKIFTPCNFENLKKVAKAIAITHVELILIHPFREGNGRLGRLLASLMANQAGYPPLDFGPIDQTINHKGFEKYIKAIHQGMNCDYSLMQEIFTEVIIISLKSA